MIGASSGMLLTIGSVLNTKSLSLLKSTSIMLMELRYNNARRNNPKTTAIIRSNFFMVYPTMNPPIPPTPNWNIIGGNISLMIHRIVDAKYK